MTRRVDGKDLQRFATEAFTSAGMPAEDAATEAEVLVWANLRGVDSHGISRIDAYVSALEKGSMNARPEIRILAERASAIFIEGDHAMGPVVTNFAVAQVAEKARATGVGWALIRNTTHQGAMGYYVERLALMGLAGICIVTNPPNMAPPGAKAAGTHNSPIGFGVPGGEHGPLIFDMATSVAAFGKLTVAMDKGESIPDTWALDEHGEPTTDPAAGRILQPAGGYKGYGLALMFECFTGLMAGNPLLSPHLLKDKEGKAKRGAQNSVVAAIDVSMFDDLDEFRQEVDDLVRAEKSLPTRPGVDEVLVPGELEKRTLADRSAKGIPMPPGTWDRLLNVAEKFSLELPREVD
ncbi:MAG: Ldh family oxidoreductase [Candidatus Latescibacterota bacterium]|nr:Ldh family oxidoreductase [Candidatus Latescibacterota bacterium]